MTDITGIFYLDFKYLHKNKHLNKYNVIVSI